MFQSPPSRYSTSSSHEIPWKKSTKRQSWCHPKWQSHSNPIQIPIHHHPFLSWNLNIFPKNMNPIRIPIKIPIRIFPFLYGDPVILPPFFPKNIEKLSDCRSNQGPRLHPLVALEVWSRVVDGRLTSPVRLGAEVRGKPCDNEGYLRGTLQCWCSMMYIYICCMFFMFVFMFVASFVSGYVCVYMIYMCLRVCCCCCCSFFDLCVWNWRCRQLCNRLQHPGICMYIYTYSSAPTPLKYG